MNAHALVVSETSISALEPAHHYHLFEGWLFRRRDPMRVELFKTAECEYCENEFSHSQLIVAERDDWALLDAGLEPARAPKLRGDRIFEEGPYLCSCCTQEWREGKIGVVGGLT